MLSSCCPSINVPSTSRRRCFSINRISAASGSHCASAASILVWYSWLANIHVVSWTHGSSTESKSSKSSAAWKIYRSALPFAVFSLLLHVTPVEHVPLGIPEIVTPHTRSSSATMFKKTEKDEPSRVEKICQSARLHSFAPVGSSTVQRFSKWLVR